MHVVKVYVIWKQETQGAYLTNRQRKNKNKKILEDVRCSNSACAHTRVPTYTYISACV